MQACVIARWGIKVVLISECGGSRSKSELSLSLSLSLSTNLFGAFGMFLESRRNAKGEWTPCDNLSTSPSRHNPLIRPPFFLLSSFSSPSSFSSFFPFAFEQRRRKRRRRRRDARLRPINYHHWYPIFESAKLYRVFLSSLLGILYFSIYPLLLVRIDRERLRYSKSSRSLIK